MPKTLLDVCKEVDPEIDAKKTQVTVSECRTKL
jgi:hypothetical protein